MATKTATAKGSTSVKTKPAGTSKSTGKATSAGTAKKPMGKK